MKPVRFNIDPKDYKHIRVEVEGAIAKLIIAIPDDGGFRDDYQLKLNSYDIGVDVEIADATRRLRYEHPEVSVVCITSGRDDGVFSAGANIFMLRTSDHAHKVNFCKFTNETRCYIEETHETSNQYYFAALNGLSSGGGYELPLACDEIHLVDDRRSAVSLPEVPYLAVLPGTGGLTRVVDKRKVRRDRADIFCSLAEGIRGEKAVEWKLVDAVHPASSFDEKIAARLEELAGDGNPHKGIDLSVLEVDYQEDSATYEFVKVKIDQEKRVATIELTGPSAEDSKIPKNAADLGSDWYGLKFWRELDDAILNLRFNYYEVGTVIIKSKGSCENVIALDNALEAQKDDWFIREVLTEMKRVLKRIDYTSRTLFTFIEPESCFAGSFFEIALASDRAYMMNHEDEENFIGISVLNGGKFPMGNGISRLETRFLDDAESVNNALGAIGKKLNAEQAYELGLVTEIPDDIDWEDEVRIAVEERVSFSPDALTGMEASLRFPGPETMETKIFARLTAWQNWIFTRPNAVGERGGLTMYGDVKNAEFDWKRV
ncbi:MAG: benzoyl-CoA-dihydrodiol lyase [Calditrichaeota bacterium]|nr:MAG: benzoyl-CoA-dihydrodiol lyase [Calditrichota bacterium]